MRDGERNGREGERKGAARDGDRVGIARRGGLAVVGGGGGGGMAAIFTAMDATVVAAEVDERLAALATEAGGTSDGVAAATVLCSPT